jgi:hypothetical protein
MTKEFVYLFFYCFLQLLKDWPIHPSIHPSIYPSIYSFIHQSIQPFMDFIFLEALEFELRTSCLLGRHSYCLSHFAIPHASIHPCMHPSIIQLSIHYPVIHPSTFQSHIHLSLINSPGYLLILSSNDMTLFIDLDLSVHELTPGTVMN